MLIHLLISLSLIVLGMFGVLQISEFGFLSGAAEQASFFAARSELVGIRGTRSGRFFAEAGKNSFHPPLRSETEVEVQNQDSGRFAHVAFEAPDFLRWMQDLFTFPTRSGRRCPDPGRFQEVPRLCGFTGIPERGFR